MMTGSGEWTLTEAARLLGEPQHRLIYLCEKGVVAPDFQEAEGRGSSRRFSARNMLEFAVALRLRDLELPAVVGGAVVHVLRQFEGRVRRQIPGFRLPDSLRPGNAPDLRVIVSDGRRLFFTLGGSKGASEVYGGIELADLMSGHGSQGALKQRLGPAKIRAGSAVGAHDGEFGAPEGSRHARLEVSVTRIAQELRLEG